MFLFFFSVVKCYQDLFATIKGKIDKLHQLKKGATYYEFFNLGENCSDSDIKKAFRKLRKSVPPADLTKEQFDDLVMNGYSVLTNYREAYDNFLRDSKYFYLGRSENFKNHIFVVLIAAVCLFVFLDFVVYAFKYLKYFEKLNQFNQMKKTNKINKGKNIKKAHKASPPTMLFMRMFGMALSRFRRRA